ncbi:MAG TPA: response regulator [Vicinamibacterales bacterium]|nr:response regulator [Vicinamibacterales bacterium]
MDRTRHGEKETADVDEALAAMMDARARFIAGFPAQCAAIQHLIATAASTPASPARASLLQTAHRMTGLAGTIGFPTVSVRASELEGLARDGAMLDGELAADMLAGLREAFTNDLSRPPEWTSSAGPQGDSVSILVIEDDPDQLVLVTGYLRSAGHRPVGLTSGDGVLEHMRLNRPALVLLDVDLPGADGFAVCRLIKADPDFSSVPVMFLTTRHTLDDRMVGLTLGADEFLTKPVDMRELLLRVQRLSARTASRTPLEPPRAPLAPEAVAPLEQELAYDAFVHVASAQLAKGPTALALVRVPAGRAGVAAASALQKEIRRRDIVGRYSETHLLLLLPGLTADAACGRARDIVSTLIAEGHGDVNAGVAASTGTDTTIEALIGEADAGLSEARYLGLPVAMRTQRQGVAVDAKPAARVIVLADDDPDVIRIVDAQMRAEGFRTVVAFDGEQAFNAVQKESPDVLVLDMMMPKMTGFEVLARLRGLPSRPKVVVLSGRGREDDVTKAFELGADDYMIKPFSPQELRARIGRLLR